MKASQIFYKIKNDSYYLLNSYLFDMALMSSIILVLIKFNLQINLPFSILTTLILIPFAVANGFVIASLLHNTSHENIKSSWLNRIVGEYCGYWVLYGFSNFVLVHLLHHQYSDDELDPVNPSGMTFLVFLSAPMRYMINTTKKFLFQTHGNSKNYKNIMNAQTVVFHFNLLLRITIWYLFLGKTLFFTFFIPGFFTIIAVFAHINFVCHRNAEDGSIEIVNLDHNLYYKIANLLTMGGYYHKNHHINMKLFNPKHLNSARSKERLWSIPQNAYYKHDPKVTFGGSAIYRYLDINNVWGEASKNRIPSKIIKSKSSTIPKFRQI